MDSRDRAPSRTLHRLFVAFFLLIVVGNTSVAGGERDAKPNVVLIICDDLNDYLTGVPGDVGHPQVQTPNADRFAATAVAFRRAYSNNPVCAPSRASLLTGIYPHTSGNLFWDKWFDNPVLANSRTLMEHFRANGYRVEGAGKLMHHHRRSDWDAFPLAADYGPTPHDGQRRTVHPTVPSPYRTVGPIDGSYGPLVNLSLSNPGWHWAYGGWGNGKVMRYQNDADRDPTPDERVATWAATRLGELADAKTERPFFLAIGFIRPHTPLHAPQKYFDLYPLDQVKLPVRKSGDSSDTFMNKVFKSSVKGLRYYRLLRESYDAPDAGLKRFTQADLACVSAVDDCIGQVLRAIDSSRLRDNTVVVLTSDHGWCMGQKDFLFKNAPWEEATRIPFIVRAPGISMSGGVVEQPISLIDLYPTLIDLCDLRGSTVKSESGAPLDGVSMKPLLVDPASQLWDGPEAALSMIHAEEDSITPMSIEDYYDPTKQHWSLRTRRWRYIRYNNAAEELYDHDEDPHEWTNLVDDPNMKSELLRMRAMLAERTGTR